MDMRGSEMTQTIEFSRRCFVFGDHFRIRIRIRNTSFPTGGGSGSEAEPKCLFLLAHMPKIPRPVEVHLHTPASNAHHQEWYLFCIKFGTGNNLYSCSSRVWDGQKSYYLSRKIKKHVVCDKRLIEEECREVLKVSYARRDYMRAGRKVYLIESATVQRFHRTKKN